MVRRAPLERLLVVVTLLAMSTACTYDPTYELNCDEEGERDGARVCRDGVWVSENAPDMAVADTSTNGGDSGCTGPDCVDVGPDAPCQPEDNATFCDRQGFDCGEVTAPDNCGEQRTILCGTCDEPETCGGAGEPNVCGCEPESDQEFCARLVKTCDDVTASDNCGSSRTVNCGTCTQPATCGGGGTDNVCACPDQTDEEFCVEHDAACGSLTALDVCDQMRTTSCGTCMDPQTCGGAGVDNQCGCPEDAQVCQTLGAECGMVDVSGSCPNKTMVDCRGCRTNASCNDADNTCECDDGFQPDALGNCEDVDECATGDNDCSDDATCNDIEGGYECTCKDGYMGDGVTCTDINECDNDPCDPNATCDNQPGSYTCTCDDGYTGDGTTCNDINECDNDPCDPNATCDNNDGGYTCTCNDGYVGDGMTCTPVTDPIVSVQTVEVTMSNGESSTSSSNFGRAIESANAVPFISLRTDASRIRDFTVDVALNDDKVDVSRAGSGGSVTVVITVVEFDPNVVSVQSDTSVGGSVALSANIDPAKSFGVFSYSTDSSHEDKDDLMVSGALTGNSFDFGRAGNNGGVSGTYWVATAQNDAFGVQHESSSIPAGESTISIPITQVDMTRSFVIYSYRTTETGTDGGNGHVSCRIDSGTEVRCARNDTNNEITNLEIQVVELAMGTVERGTTILAGTTPAETENLTDTFDNRSMPWLGQTGAHGACRTAEVDNNGTPSSFATGMLSGSSAIRVERDSNATDEIRCTWEAIKW